MSMMNKNIPIEYVVDKMVRIVFSFLYIDSGFTSYLQGGKSFILE